MCRKRAGCVIGAVYFLTVTFLYRPLVANDDPPANGRSAPTDNRPATDRPTAADGRAVRGGRATAESVGTESVIMHVNRSADSLAKTLSVHFRGDGSLSLIPDSTGNSLILRGERTVVAEAAELIRSLDRPQQQVQISISIAVKKSSDLPEDSGLRLLDQLELTTLDDNRATLQFGQQVAVPTGSTSFGGGRPMSRTYQQQQVGTMVNVQPRIAPEGIFLSLALEKSWHESAATESDNANADPIPRYTTYSTTSERKHQRGQVPLLAHWVVVCRVCCNF